MNQLTPKQAADVITYYHNGENAYARRNGWPDKVSLGQAAVQTTMTRHSLLPNGEPLLTSEEMSAGIKYFAEEEVDGFTDGELDVIAAQVDQGVGSYHDARRRAS